MNKVKVISAFIPIPVRHLSPEGYRELGGRLMRACGETPVHVFEHPLEECWLAKRNPPMVPAAPVPPDRYASPADNVKSHIVQHNRTTWALQAAAEDSNIDVIVWFDFGLLKQGHWNGHPIEEMHVREFLAKVERYPFDDMPFPGIEEKKPIDVHGNNWRFCGSTHIWPVKWLREIDRAYKRELIRFIEQHQCVPLDLAIWPAVEEALAGTVPFAWYKGDYDSTQLTGFPHAGRKSELRPMTPLCVLAKKHETDKGGRHLRYGGQPSNTCHEYTPIYWDLLSDQTHTVRNVLEIGVNAGSSLRMWEEFFPNAKIFGLDLRSECLVNEGRIQCVLADQGSLMSLEAALQAMGTMLNESGPLFDLIIDDGSHEPQHQITSLVKLLPYLSKDGIYVVEDLQDDCHPEVIAQHVPPGFSWEAIPAPGGLGNAHCPCSTCGGKGREQLLVVRRAPL